MIWLSIGAALATMALKTTAAYLTDSVGYWSDALESIVNLVAALVALWALRLAVKPADDKHPFGYTKAEYVSGGFEAALVLVAAAGIAWAAVQRLIHPHPIAPTIAGVLLVLAATLINLVVGQTLLRVGRRTRSLALEADGHHLMSDVWTSTGILAAVAFANRPGLQWLDAAAALLMAGYVALTGARILRRALQGLLDVRLSDAELTTIQSLLDARSTDGVRWHALRTRVAGRRSFVNLHLLVPGSWSVQRAHEYVETLERDIRAALHNGNVSTHVEPIEDPAALADEPLDYDEGLAKSPPHEP